MFSRRRLIGLALVAVGVLLFSTWVFTTPPLLPVVGERYAIPIGSDCAQGYFSTGERIGDGWVSLCFTIHAPEGPVKAGTPWSYVLWISKISDNVTGPFYKGITIKINGVSVKDRASGAQIQDKVVDIFFDGEVQVVSIYMLGRSSLTARQMVFELNYDICAVLPVGYIPLKNEQMGVQYNLNVTSETT